MFLLLVYSITIASILQAIKKTCLFHNSKRRSSRSSRETRIISLWEISSIRSKLSIAICRTRNCYRTMTSRPDLNPMASPWWALRKKLKTHVSLRTIKVDVIMSFKLRLLPLENKLQEENQRSLPHKEMLLKRLIQAMLYAEKSTGLLENLQNWRMNVPAMEKRLVAWRTWTIWKVKRTPNRIIASRAWTTNSIKHKKEQQNLARWLMLVNLNWEEPLRTMRLLLLNLCVKEMNKVIMEKKQLNWPEP